MVIQSGPSMCYICGHYSRDVINSSHYNDHMKKGELPTKYKIAKYSLIYKIRSLFDKTIDRL